MVDPADVQKYIEEGMQCDFIKVVGDGHHFEALIVSPEFEGKSRVQQHQRVYAALGGRMDSGEVHALSMKLFTPAVWETKKAQYQLD